MGKEKGEIGSTKMITGDQKVGEMGVRNEREEIEIREKEKKEGIESRHTDRSPREVREAD